MLSSADAERVAELMRETAATELLPRFRSLAKEDIRLKGPGDFVTVADVASEQRLAAGLAKILPGVPVVGEEAVEKEPDLVDLIARPGESCWIVDPLDGTANFARRQGPSSPSSSAWCTTPWRSAAGSSTCRRGRMAMALKGQGVTLDGAPVRRREACAAADRLRRLQGPQGIRPPAAAGQAAHAGARLDPATAPARSIIEILAGRADFNLYRMTKPWDHAAGALMVAEAGGEAQRFDGKPYAPAQPINSGLITAIHPQTLAAGAHAVRGGAHAAAGGAAEGLARRRDRRDLAGLLSEVPRCARA